MDKFLVPAVQKPLDGEVEIAGAKKLEVLSQNLLTKAKQADLPIQMKDITLS